MCHGVDTRRGYKRSMTSSETRRPVATAHRKVSEPLSIQQVSQLAALARAWCRALHLDEASAALRTLSAGAPAVSDPSGLRRAAGLDDAASVGEVLEALAERTTDAVASAQLARAAELAWEEEMP